MKIKDVRVTSVRMGGRKAATPQFASFCGPTAKYNDWPWRSPDFVALALIEVITDEGISGIGTVGVGAALAEPIVGEYLAPLIIGEHAGEIEMLWEKMYRFTVHFGRKGAVPAVISGIDIALWDIAGKAANKPIYELLGGKVRDKIPVYASRLYAQATETLLEEARGYIQQGFKAMKQRFAYPAEAGLDGMRKNVELVRRVREAIGDDIDLMADAYMGWDREYANRILPRLEEFNLRWVEEPLLPDDIEGYAELSRISKTPISGGEHEFTRFGFKELIDRRAVSILQPDVNRVGGFTEARKICAMAAAHDLPVIPHAGQMHNYHLILSQTNCPIAEYFPKVEPLDVNTIFWSVFEGEPEARDGYVTLNSAPGLGLRVRKDFVGDIRT